MINGSDGEAGCRKSTRHRSRGSYWLLKALGGSLLLTQAAPTGRIKMSYTILCSGLLHLKPEFNKYLHGPEPSFRNWSSNLGSQSGDLENTVL